MSSTAPLPSEDISAEHAADLRLDYLLDMAADPLLPRHLGVAVVREGLTLFADHAELRLALADLLIADGEDGAIEEAEEICRELLSHGSGAPAAARLAALTLEDGRVEDAETYAQIAIDGGEPTAAATLAMVLRERGEDEAAAPRFLQAYEANPSNWSLLKEYCELTGEPWRDPTMHLDVDEMYLDPLHRVWLRRYVYEQLAPTFDDPPDEVDTFAATRRWALDHELEPTRVYTMLVRLGMLCDWDVIDHHCSADWLAARVHVSGWIAGTGGDLLRAMDRLSDGLFAREIAVAPADPVSPACKVDDPEPLAARIDGHEIAIWPQLRHIEDLLPLLDRARTCLGSARLTLLVNFVDSAEYPIVVVSDSSATEVATAGPASRDLLPRADYTRVDRLLVDERTYAPPVFTAGGDLLPEEREWLLDELEDLIAHDPEPFVRPALIELPRLGSGLTVQRTAANVTRALMQHAGLGHLGLRISMRPPRRADDPCTDSDVLAWFRGIEDDCCVFGLDPNLHSDLAELIATMAHEVAHAYRHYHELMVEDRDVEERLTDVTTIYLGFGLFTTNSSYRFESTGWMVGLAAFSAWRHSRRGYLPPQAMSFLLAAQTIAHNADRARRNRLVRRLGANQRGFFRDALRALGSVAAVRQSLALPELAELGHEEPELHIVDDPDDEAEIVSEQPTQDAPTVKMLPHFRLRIRSWSRSTTLCLLLAPVVGVVAWSVMGAVGAAIAGPGWVILSLVAGPRARALVCTGCRTRVTADDTTCPGCETQLVRDVAGDEDWAQAEREVEAEAIRELLRTELGEVVEPAGQATG